MIISWTAYGKYRDQDIAIDNPGALRLCDILW